MGPVIALLLGASLYALALPPFDYNVFGWVLLTPLLMVIRGRRPVAAFVHGLLFGGACAASVTWWAAQAAAHFFGMPVVLAVAGLWAYYLVVCGSTFGLFA